VSITFTWAAARAPTTDPTLSTEYSNVNEPLLPWRVCATKSGITTAKLNVSVPTIVIIVSGIHRSGTSWMQRTAARS
jgi:hypothetical protein